MPRKLRAKKQRQYYPVLAKRIKEMFNVQNVREMKDYPSSPTNPSMLPCALQSVTKLPRGGLLRQMAGVSVAQLELLKYSKVFQ